MPRSATDPKTSARLASSKISDCGLSRRQKQLLEGLFALFSSEMAPRLGQMLIDLEQQMSAAAAQAGSEDAQRLFEAQRQIHARRNELPPRFLARVEAALASVAEPPANTPSPSISPQFSELALVDTGDMDEAVALKEIAARIEQRSTLPLFLLGQRLGAVAGGPAFDTQSLPLGPHRLCQALGEAAEVFELDAARRALLYRQFDLSVLRFAGPLFEALNHYLISEGVFPNLAFVPPRRQASQQGREQARDNLPEPPPQTRPDAGQIMHPFGTANTAGTARAAAPVPFHSTHSPRPSRPSSQAAMPLAPHPVTPSMGPAPPMGTAPRPHATGPAASLSAGIGMNPARRIPDAVRAPAPTPASLPVSDTAGDSPDTLPWNALELPGEAAPPDVESFDILRRLLAGRRNLIDRLKPGGSSVSNAPLATPQQVQLGLDRLQHQMSRMPAQAPNAAFADIRRQLLEQLRRSTPDGRPPRLSPEQGDTLSLVGMLFDQIGQEVRPSSPGGQLLAQLQVPLLRVAMQDEGFFIDRNNPARQLLNAIAEAGAYWSSEDETDTELMQKMSALVRRITTEYDGQNPALFSDLMTDLTAHLTAQQHKAEISERRHVEAARGREKLEIARLQAEEAINSLLEGKPVPRFLRSLLEHVWTDVIALALLRGGETSSAFQQHMALTRRLVAATVQCSQTGKRALAVSEAEAMQNNITEALLRIGQNQEDATEIARRMLLSATTESAPSRTEDEDEDDAASRNELVMKLQGRNRLGQDVQDTVSARARIKAERIASLSPDEKRWHDQLQQLPFGAWFEFTLGNGEKVRRRMSWYSTVTDHCLFVNHRGQRIGEYTLCWLARELARGSVKPIETARESIVDRAWNAIVKALRSFVGQPALLQTSAVPG